MGDPLGLAWPGWFRISQGNRNRKKMAYTFVLACGVLALLYGAYASKSVLSSPAGTPRMQEIAAAVQELSLIHI